MEIRMAHNAAEAKRVRSAEDKAAEAHRGCLSLKKENKFSSIVSNMNNDLERRYCSVVLLSGTAQWYCSMSCSQFWII